MSTYKAIAGVSSSIRNLLLDRMNEVADVTIAPPDVTVGNIAGRRLNIYLYHVAENASLKNQQLPRVGHDAGYGFPPLSLNLHYLFTSFGGSESAPDADLEAQHILGDAMRVMHDFALIGADLVRLKTVGTPPVLDSSLIDEFEQVKVVLEPKTVDEISKIWTALPRVNFRRSVAYGASVVQIESGRTRRMPLPVRARSVYALPLSSPVIRQIFRQPPLSGLPVAGAEEGETLRITGENLRSANTRVTIDSTDAPIVALQNEQINFSIPVNKFKIGLHTVQVAQDVMLAIGKDLPPEKRTAFHSNAVGFMLLPKLVDIQPQPSASPSETVTVEISPPVLPGQESFLLLGDFVVPAMPAKFGSAPANAIKFKLPEAPEPVIPAGTYLLRVRVDGAETRLTLDPGTKKYTGPTYELT